MSQADYFTLWTTAQDAGAVLLGLLVPVLICAGAVRVITAMVRPPSSR